MADKKALIEQENNGFGPILKCRSNNRSFWTSVFMLLVSSVLLVFISIREKDQGKIHVLLFAAAFSYIFLFLGECFRRLILFTEEYYHKDARYHGDFAKAWKTTFAFVYPGRVVIVFIVALICSALAWYEHSNNITSNTLWFELFIINIIMMPSISSLTGLRIPSLVEQSDINEHEDKNVADGLAWSYYFGYLKLVLPSIQKKIEESEYRGLISVPKLLILVPRNCYTYGKLEEADKCLKSVGPTPELRINRGGIVGRVYKHTVYKITTTNKVTQQPEEFHCLLEYATPLMCMYDMSEHSEAGLSKEDRDTQVQIFMNKLRDILDNAEARVKDTYMLLPFSGQKDTIAQTVMDAINQESVRL